MGPGQKQNIDIKQTTPFTSEDGSHLFTEGVVFRKVSKFLTASSEDGLIPIPCFFSVQTGKIALELLPQDLREEYKKYNQEIDKKNKK